LRKFLAFYANESRMRPLEISPLPEEIPPYMSGRYLPPIPLALYTEVLP